MNGLKPILVIESRPKDLEQTLAALANRGLANPILVARTREEALGYLAEHEGAALVLLDVADAGGPETLNEVRAQAPMAPVVALVAAGQHGRIRREHPTVLVVAKPLKPEALLSAVHDLGQALAIVGQAKPLGAYVPAKAEG